MEKFASDLHAPLPAKVEAQPQPKPTPVPVIEAHQVDEPAPKGRVLPSGTVRTDADGSAGWLNKFGQVTNTKPIAPEKAVPATVRYDPNAKYPDSGESQAPWQVENGKVRNMATGEYVEGKMEEQMSGFSVLVRGMTSRKL